MEVNSAGVTAIRFYNLVILSCAGWLHTITFRSLLLNALEA